MERVHKPRTHRIHLGFAATDGADLFRVIGVLQSIGKQATILSASEKLGHLLFVCEFMMGAPLVSAQYYHRHESSVMQVQKNPCWSSPNSEIHLNIHKDTFLFVPPAHWPAWTSVETEQPEFTVPITEAGLTAASSTP